MTMDQTATETVDTPSSPKWIKTLATLITLVILGTGGTLGAYQFQDSDPADHPPVSAEAFTELRAAQDRMAAQTNSLAERINALERTSEAQHGNIAHISQTLATLVDEVRENTKQTARLAGALEQIQR